MTNSLQYIKFVRLVEAPLTQEGGEEEENGIINELEYKVYKYFEEVCDAAESDINILAFVGSYKELGHSDSWIPEFDDWIFENDLTTIEGIEEYLRKLINESLTLSTDMTIPVSQLDKAALLRLQKQLPSRIQCIDYVDTAFSIYDFSHEINSNLEVLGVTSIDDTYTELETELYIAIVLITNNKKEQNVWQ